ncbi:hypothetical protein LZG07_16545 [Microbacterium profundi]|uniref:hypothetical protein n=1 Tax=Microbacterium profundi TaxID=450380 RepID=UPI001F26BA72|nr:hypothetical protein [Microbacterium profundi]MCE7483508.1 hypothetical protein [Microbacterium profundi]
MNPVPDRDFDALKRAALQATSGWSEAKASMAIRATGLASSAGDRASLDVIAADFSVSRETVRRARNELLRALDAPPGTAADAVFSMLSLSAPFEPSAASPATARALRRLLTMTGPLAWDEVLSAWARGGGKPPYSALPADIESMRNWASRVGGFSVSDGDAASVVIAAARDEELDQVSQYLLDMLSARPGGIDRGTLLEQADAAGLKPTTIATALSTHPAVTRVGRGTWALRGQRLGTNGESTRIAEPRPTGRARPTSFTWGADGALLIEFSIPRGPSPVVAVPTAVSQIVDGREFGIEETEKQTRISVKNARLWGFGPLLSELGLTGGTRAVIALNLLSGTATISATRVKGTSG